MDETVNESGRLVPALPRVLWFWGPVIGYAATIFYLSSLSHPEEELPSFLWELGDKALHGGEYAVLGWLCCRALRGVSPATLARRAALAGAILASLYGVSDEVHQAFVPSREMSVLDMVADSIGAACAASLWSWWSRSHSLESAEETGSRYQA
jgi:VanZ family protein